MHEFSLVRALLDQVAAICREQDADGVASIRVRVGEFSGVEPDLFRFAFESLVEGTPMSRAELELIQTPLRLRCGDCESELEARRFRFECRRCGSRNVTIEGGQELLLESVTVEHDEPDPSFSERSPATPSSATGSQS